MTKRLIVRRMTQQDLDTVLAIEHACSIDPWSHAIFSACIERHPCYVLTLDQQVIGFAVMMFTADECQLLNIAITPAHQHLGYGKLFLSELIGFARKEKVQELHLEVRCSNAGAIALYQKLGFSIIGHRKEYYLTPTGREDAHLMRLKL